MKKVYLGILLVAVMALSLPMGTSAAENAKPAQFAFWHPWQVFDENTSIGGFRFNMLYGYNKDVTGLDFGMVNRTSGNVTGIQLGVVNMVGGDFTGWQDAVVNLTDGNLTGLQAGLYNSTKKHAKGVQLGIANVAGSLYGLQIGLVNFNLSGKPFKFLPVVNFSF